MLRYVHRTGVGVVAWRQASGAAAATTCAPRDNHRRVVSRGRVVRTVPGFTAAGVSSVSSDCTASYSIITRVSADAAASYAIRSAVVSDAVASYAILSASAVQSDCAASYAIRAAVLADLAAVYAIGAGSTPTAADIAAQVRIELAAELAQITKLSKIHGIGVPLVVTPTSRTAGDVAQTITTVGDTTTVVEA